MPRLIRPTVETEQPPPLTEEQHAQLNRVLGPGPQGQTHTLPADFEEKRQAELEKMGLGNEQPPAAVVLAPGEYDMVRTGWKPDPHVTAMLGLKGETAAELTRELDAEMHKRVFEAVPEEPDINAQLEKFFEDEKDIEEQETIPEEESVDFAGAERGKYRARYHARDPHIVPLEEQVTEEEEDDIRTREERLLDSAINALESRERETPQSLLQQASRPKIEGRPWSDFADPITATAPLHHFSLAADGDTLALVLQPDNQLATVTVEALAALGKRCAFPPEFVGKLPAELAAEVVNDRISVADNHEMTVLLQNGQWTAILPAWRGITPWRVVCDTAYDTLARHYAGIEIDRLETNGSLHLRLLTPVIYPVTEGDTLQMGIDLTFSYNTTLTVSLLVRRGDGGEMTAYPQSFSWRARTGDAGSAERQLEWLQNAVLYAIGNYMGFVEKAKELSEHRDSVMTSNDFNIPKKYLPKLKEMGGTAIANEWETVGILVQFALDYEEGNELQAMLGDYVANWSE